METLAELGHGGGEVTDGEVGFGDVAQQGFQLFLAKAAHGFYLKNTAREVGDDLIGGIEVTVGVQFLQAKALGQATMGSCFEQGGIGLVKGLADALGQVGGALLLFGLGENKRLCLFFLDVDAMDRGVVNVGSSVFG